MADDQAVQRLEVSLITRAMMELAVNQGLLNTDPKLAIRYSLEMQSGNEQLIARMDEYGTGISDEGAEKAAQVEEVAAQLRSMGFDEWPRRHSHAGESCPEVALAYGHR